MHKKKKKNDKDLLKFIILTSLNVLKFIQPFMIDNFAQITSLNVLIIIYLKIILIIIYLNLITIRICSNLLLK